MDDFDLEIKREFINEALMNLEEAEGSFMELESAADPKPLLDKIFRLAHNLKGGSRAVGFGHVAEFTHQLENLVLKIQKNEVPLTPDVVTTLLRSNDRLVEMLSNLKADISATSDNSDLIQDIQNWLEGKNSPSLAPVAPVAPSLETQPQNDLGSHESQIEKTETAPELEGVPSAAAFFDTPMTSETPDTPAPSAPQSQAEPTPAMAAPLPKPTPSASPSEAKSKDKDNEIIRVSLSRIDLLNDYVGELIVLQSVIQQQAAQSVSTKLHTSLRQMVKLSKDIQHLSMSLRMLPVKPLIQKLQRVVRDTAQTLGKSVSLDVIGEHLDIDKSVLDRLADPLIHILRNAVDHGIESPEGRTKAGKSTEGHVTLSFSNEGNHLVIEIFDDGKGIDGEVLRKKAIEKKLIAEGQGLSEKQLIHLIFHPGFSTKTETSEISGRGVGMDVVKTNVEQIGGHVDVTTRLGQGSHFRLQIPLSLAVIEGLVVTSEVNRYVIPLNQIQETINLKSHRIFDSKVGIGSCFDLRGNVVPLVNIEEALGQKKSESTISVSDTGLIINVGDQLMSIVVKDILRAQQIVIKPLGSGIRPQKGWIGSCVLGDGLPTLIVSPVDLLKGKVSQKLHEQRTGGAA